MNKHTLSFAIVGSLLTASQSVFAAAFVVQDIQVQGLQRVAVGTVLSYLPARVGQPFDEARSDEAILALSQSGLFEDVRLARQGNVLVVSVVERPAIGDIKITGNSKIKTEQLLSALKSMGLGKGDTLNKTVLANLHKELEQQYLAMGYYGAAVDTSVQPLDNNRVAININVKEGDIARIKQVKITGNKAFSESELLGQMESGTPGLFSIPVFSDRDKYAKEKLSGDLDALSSFYRDRGYLKFEITSTDVSLSPDKKGVSITIGVNEGEQYRLGKIRVEGAGQLNQQQLAEAVKLREGDIFSQKALEETRKNLATQYGKQGYAFARIKAAPDLDEASKRIGVILNVEGGKRTYVRRIIIRGNNRTRDEVYRRELRQLESSWFAADQVERSKIRLQRLPYVEDVRITTEPVAGTNDQVDLTVVVSERSSNQFRIGAGYSQSQGLLLNLALNQDNFMGTGKQLEINLDNSEANKNFLISYDNPYYTQEGISRGFSLYYNKYDAAAEDISDFVSNKYGGNVKFTMPLGENDAVNLTVGAEKREIVLGDAPATHIKSFTDQHGLDYKQFPATVSYVHDTRNRAIFPTDGQRHRLALQATLPGSDLQYQKLSYDGAFYKAINDDFTFSVKAKVAAGQGRGELDSLPFFEKYTAGGIRSVRGFEQNSLGPRDSKGDAKGGDALATATAEVLFPMPLAADVKSVKMSAFVDAGNVFDTKDDFKSSEIRYAAGLGLVWLSPIGPFELSYAKPLNAKEGDKEQVVQFSIGASF